MPTQPDPPAAASPDDGLVTRALAVLREEVDRMFAQHAELAEANRRYGDERATSLRAAADKENAAHAAEEHAWGAWAAARDQLRDRPGDLAALAAADQAEAACDTARADRRIHAGPAADRRLRTRKQRGAGAGPSGPGHPGRLVRGHPAAHPGLDSMTTPLGAAPRTPALPGLHGPALVLLIGAAGSGKSTLARAHYRPTQIVSLDALRATVSDDECDQDATADAVALLHAIVAARLARGLTTVVDATNGVAAERAPLLALAAAHEVPAAAVVIDTALDVCLARQHDRPRPAPGRRWGRAVPASVVRNQHARTRASLADLTAAGIPVLHLHEPVTTAPTGAAQQTGGAAHG